MTTFIEKQACEFFEQQPGELTNEKPSKLSEDRPSGGVNEQLDLTDQSAVPTERARRKYVRGSRPARVTKVSIERLSPEISSELKPRLKTGVQISVPIAETEKSLIIATAHRAITIHHPGARAIVAKFDGEHSAHQISDEINAPIEVVENVITE